MLKTISYIVALAIAFPASAQLNADRAIQNYRDLNAGRRQLADLTPFERAEVAEVDKIVRSRKLDERSAAQRCRDEELHASDGTVTHLERRVIELKCSQR